MAREHTHVRQQHTVRSRARTRRRLASVATCAAAALVPLTVAPAAVADETSDSGLWYYYALGLDEIHASGIDGSGVTIAIIDSPINLDVPTLQGTNIDVQTSFCLDESGNPRSSFSDDEILADHGTQMASLIVGTGAGYPSQEGVRGVAPGAHILYYSHYLDADELQCFDDEGFLDGSFQIIHAIDDAIDQGADIISMSFMGTAGLSEVIARAHREGVILVAGLSNDEIAAFSGDSAPGASNGVLSVLASGLDGELSTDGFDSPNDSLLADVVAPGVGVLAQGGFGDGWDKQYLRDGTSIATPIVAGNIALAMQKYPQATPNQLLQSVIHNTGTGTEAGTELSWTKEFGYGTVVPSHLLAVDPTQYEDVNPFITEDSIFGPSIVEIFGEPGVTPTPGSTTTGPVTDTDASALMPLIIGGGIIIFLIIAAIVIIAIVTSRKKTENTHG